MKKCLLVVSIIFIILSLVITVNAENIIEEVKAKVVEVDLDKKRIELSIRELEEAMPATEEVEGQTSL